MKSLEPLLYYQVALLPSQKFEKDFFGQGLSRETKGRKRKQLLLYDTWHYRTQIVN